tara:strand:+ start:1341 stop:1895 length:555 start_codon:yes stop_codon:yes gene_type:complete
MLSITKKERGKSTINIFVVDIFFGLSFLVSIICSYFTIIEIKHLYKSFTYFDSFIEILTFFSFGKFDNLNNIFINETSRLLETKLQSLTYETSKICLSRSSNFIELVIKSIFSNNVSIDCSKNVMKNLFSKDFNNMIYDSLIKLEMYSASISHIKNLGIRGASLGYGFVTYVYWRIKPINLIEK